MCTSVRWQSVLVAALAFVLIAVATTDAIRADSTAAAIRRSNDTAIREIVRTIGSSWQSAQKPLVLSEPPTLAQLMDEPQIRVMTDHLISLPDREEPIDSTLRRLQVNYAVLYNSPTFPKQRDQTDSLYRVLMRKGTIIHRAVGTSGARRTHHTTSGLDRRPTSSLPS